MNNPSFSGFPPSEQVVHNFSFFTQDANQEEYQYIPTNTPITVPSPQSQNTTAPTGDQTVLLTTEQTIGLIEQCKPVQMGNPVKITEPSYLISEQQMIYLLSLAQGKPVPNLMPQKKGHVLKPNVAQEQQIVIGPQAEKQSHNVVDTVFNATLGTVGRIGHAFTGVVDSAVDVLTLGYGNRK